MKRRVIDNINEIIEYGLDDITLDKKITIELKDYIFVYKTIEELRRFFHNRDHYKNLEYIHKYVGNGKEGILSVLDKLYLDNLDKFLTPEIEELLESDSIDCNDIPFYYNHNNTTRR